MSEARVGMTSVTTNMVSAEESRKQWDKVPLLDLPVA